MMIKGKIISIKTGKDINGPEGGKATIAVEIPSSDAWALLRSQTHIPGWMAEHFEEAILSLNHPIKVEIALEKGGD